MNDMNTQGGEVIDQAKLRFLVEKNADGIIVVDENGIVLFANPAAERLFGRMSMQLVGRPIGIPSIAGDTTEIVIHKPDGEHVDAEIRVVETAWDRRPARLASLRDISARKAAEERQRHSARMEAVGLLTAGIAHDFNNLLTVVIGNLENAQRRLAAADAGLPSALENALHGARQAAKLTERLLAFARRKPLEPRVIDANALVLGMSNLIRHTLGESISVRTELAADPWRVEIDPTELEATILNLAVNARDAMPSGGQLLIETANIELDTRYEAADGDLISGAYLLVSVTDTGTGMSADVLRHVFEPFFTTKAGGHGTGLGLSQVYGFIKQSGGHVKLYSEPGLGTSVKLYLPKALDDLASDWTPASPPQAVAAVPHARPGEAILVVEDEADVRDYAVGSLKELGYRVFEAGDGATALEVIRREPCIRLLFTDLGLPGGMDGRALADRALSIRSSLKILMTTAYAAGALVHEGRLDADIQLLSKPFGFSELAMRIRKLLDHEEDPAEVSVLIVEDEFLVRMVVADVLTGAGYKPLEAHNASAGLVAFQSVSDAVAAAIVDLGLPDRRGDELLADIRAVRPDLPVVLATGYADDGLARRFASDSRLIVLAKPFDPKALLAALQQLGVRVRL